MAPRSISNKPCSVSECERNHYALGFCEKHWKAVRRNGDTELRMEAHGMDRTPTYNSWQKMIQRCTNPNHISYKNYGAIGVEVCPEWRKSFTAFMSDMGERPPGMTLDRINPRDNYRKGNCRWASATTQNRNQRNSKMTQGVVDSMRFLAVWYGLNATEIGNMFGVKNTHARSIIGGQKWRDAPDYQKQVAG